MFNKLKEQIGGHWQQISRALGYAKSERRYILIVLFCALTVAAIGVAEPLLMRHIFDSLGSKSSLDQVLITAAGLVAMAFMKEAISARSNYLTWRTRLSIHQGLLSATVERLHRLPLENQRREGIGAIMTKLDRGIQGFLGALSEVIFNLAPALTYLSLAIIVMLQLDWRMTLLVLAFAPLPAIIAAWAAPTQSKREEFLMHKWGKIYSRFNEVLSGIVTVRSFAMEDYEKNRFLSNVGEANQTVVNGVGFDSKIRAAQNLSVTLATVSAVTFGSMLVLRDEMTLGTLVAFIAYVGGLFGPVQNLTNIYRIIRTASASLGHIFSILDTQDFLGDAPDAKELKQVKGEICFEDVHFHYNATHRPILKGINLRIKAGETIAFVGPSGTGKSTMTALIQRFYDPASGTISIDGQDIRSLKQQSIRQNIGVVLQDALLFNESIRDNIAYGRPDASFREIEEAAKAANAHEFIMKLANGYDTMAGERGGNLSVGERQRIAIARAILKNPPILILDEATSAMDVELEAQVQEALERLMLGRTSIVIAHRLSTVVKSDRILVLKDGAILEAGSHQGLMVANGYYASLVNRQVRGLLVA
ncbi:ABC transporter ATP-binding protein [Cesiribacter sp. SM1]|uniref:ABC transporter ATP-binding protein n=1 Tax=Cesiribacter sp. SM1 TaxID=2861196 RepID=UPI001CD812C4|nr:ABC transporter ATP-binding protein [Cesiribacter sp. SM1]